MLGAKTAPALGTTGGTGDGARTGLTGFVIIFGTLNQG